MLYISVQFVFEADVLKVGNTRAVEVLDWASTATQPTFTRTRLGQ